VSARILALDTTGDLGSIALVSGGALIEEIQLESSDGFAHVLFGAIEKLLAQHSLSPNDIDVFASASGPGSFTGVRVGLTAAKGLAEAACRKVIAVSNLQALASLGTHALRAVVLDARRGEIYGAVYNERLEAVCGEVVMKFEKWLETVPEGDLEFITSGFSGTFPGPVIQAPRTLAAAIGKIACQRTGSAMDPAMIDANYVRRSDAELYWKD